MSVGKWAALAAATWLAAADASAQTVNQAAPSSPFASMLQGLIGLAVVVALIFAAGWLLKKVGPRTRAAGLVQVVGGASVGPREKVVVVKFGQQTLLLGVAAGQVSLLHAAGPDEIVDEPAASSDTPRFVDRLRAARSAR